MWTHVRLNMYIWGLQLNLTLIADTWLERLDILTNSKVEESDIYRECSQSISPVFNILFKVWWIVTSLDVTGKRGIDHGMIILIDALCVKQCFFPPRNVSIFLHYLILSYASSVVLGMAMLVDQSTSLDPTEISIKDGLP